MFQKEAKERARKLEESQTLGVYDNDEDYARDSGWNEGEVVGYEKGFQDGAEFGYNKANEWHYPSKGEYPIDKTEMLVYFKYADYEYPCKTFGFYNGHFWDTKRGDVSNKEVIAWKEIILPKEIKEK